MLGKAAFYFGFIFFGLELVSVTLKPLAETPFFNELVHRADAPLMGVLAGAALTALVQSSTVVTGLCILMVQQGILTVHRAIPIVIGTNIGTTLKGLLITIGMQHTARNCRHRQYLLQRHWGTTTCAVFYSFLCGDG
jgi:Na+/phosphate symporter